MRRLYLIVLVCLLALTAQAQKLTVEQMTVAGNDISASQYERKDLNGQACALVKVLLPMPGAVFEGNVIGNVDFKTGEYWVYMTAGSKELRIKHPQAQPVQAVFKDYGIDRLTSKTTYMLSVLLPQTAVTQTQKLVINYSPANATVLVDSKLQQGNGHIEIVLPVGSHDYIIAANGYETAEGSVKLTAGSPRTITENLNRTATQQVAANNVQQQTVQQQSVQQQSVQQPVQQSVAYNSSQSSSNVSQTASNVNLSVREVKSFTHISGPALLSYGIVAGSFGLQANADGLAKRLSAQGYNPIVIQEQPTNMYRVIAVTTHDKGEAASQQNSLRGTYSNCWALFNPNATSAATTTTASAATTATGAARPAATFRAETFTFESGDLFDKNDQLTDKGKIALGKVAVVLEENPETQVTITVGIPQIKTKSAYKKAYYKAKSMDARPTAIEAFLTGLNISSSRIKKSDTTVEGLDARLLVQ